MNSADYIEKIKKEYKFDSYYKVAKLLNKRPTTILNYKNKERVMDNDMCIEVARVLDIPAEKVVLDISIERSKSSKEKKLWKNIASALPSFTAVTICFNQLFIYILC